MGSFPPPRRGCLLPRGEEAQRVPVMGRLFVLKKALGNLGQPTLTPRFSVVSPPAARGSEALLSPDLLATVATPGTCEQRAGLLLLRRAAGFRGREGPDPGPLPPIISRATLASPGHPGCTVDWTAFTISWQHDYAPTPAHSTRVRFRSCPTSYTIGPSARGDGHPSTMDRALST
jgi:hypothetical protein